MTQYLSRLIVPGFGLYTDFFPQPIITAGAYEAADYEATDFYTTEYSAETPLMDGAETKLLSPLVFEHALPDTADGTPGVRRLSADLSNINLSKIPAPRQLLGVPATGELWEVDTSTRIEVQSGLITEINCSPERMSLSIEENVTEPLQQLIPKRMVRDLFPSADFSGLGGTGDPGIVLPWGTMYKVPLPLVQRPYLHAEFQMQASGDSACYIQFTDVPDYTVQPGDVLRYDIYWPLPGSQVAFDVATTDGFTLRATGTVDTNGISAHPGTDLDALAYGKWYRREIPLTAMVGRTLHYYTLGCECNTTRPCAGDFANAEIISSLGELRLTIFNELSTPSPIVIVNTPVTNLAGLVRQDSWYYGAIRSNALTVHSVYNGTAVVDPSLYTIGEPLPSIKSVFFTSPPRDPSGQPAVISATISSTEFNRNPALIKQFLLSDLTDGCGVAVDSPSFGDATTILDSAGIVAEGGLFMQRTALDVIRDLCFYGEHIGVNDLGAYTDTADSAALHTLSPLRMGEGDGEWENVSFAPASYRLLDQLKQLTIKAFQVHDFGGSETYAVSAGRNGAVLGSTVTEESPYLSPTSVDREVYYRFTKNTPASLYRADVTAKSMELRDVDVNDLVVLHLPNDPDLDGRTMQVVQRTLSADGLSFRLRGYDAATYSYVSQPVNTAGIPPLVDFRFTTPLPPTNFVIVSSVVQTASDGSKKTFVTVQADAPAFNVTDLKFRAIPVGSVLFTEVTQPVIPGQTGVQATHVLEPGLTYHFQVHSYNGQNAPEYRYSAPAEILNYTAPGDTTVPADPFGIQVRQSGTKTVEVTISAFVPADWSTTYLYRNTVNNPASAVVIEVGKKLAFHDQNIAYGTTYYYWGRIGDTTGNLSGFSPSASILIGRLITDDYSDDSVETTKIASLAVTTAKIDNLAVTNAKINDVNAGKITTGLLTVHPSTGGATAIFVDNAGKIRLKALTGTPAVIAFENASGVQLGSISGNSAGDIQCTNAGPWNITASSMRLNCGVGQINVDSSIYLPNPLFAITPVATVGGLAGYWEVRNAAGANLRIPVYSTL